MASTLDRWYTIADKYLLRFSSIDTVVVCRVCCACVCELFFVLLFIIIIILLLFFVLFAMSVMYVKINVIIVRQLK